MKKAFSLLCGIIFLSVTHSARGADKLVLQLKWLHQAQFSGYYAAQANGYYADENLEVDIRPGGPNINPIAIIAAGSADVIVEWMPAALHAREQSIPLVNIAQPFRRSATSLTCLQSAGIRTLDDLRGKRIGHWPGPDSLQLKVLLAKLGIPTDAKAEGAAKLIEYGNTTYGLNIGKVDCATTLSYIDPILLADAGFHDNELVVFKYDNLSVATLEDGLWVLEARLRDSEFSSTLARFVRASMRGWRWVEQNQTAAVNMVLEVMGSEVEEEHQRFMMHEIAKLTAGTNGALDMADYERTVEVLLDVPKADSQVEQTITKPPQNAWTSNITDRAQIYEVSRFDRLLETMQQWIEHFILNLLNPENAMTHIYNVLVVASMMMRRLIFLRSIFITALVAALLNDIFWRQDSGTLFWTLTLLIINAIQLSYFTIADRFAKFTAEEEEMLTSQLPTLSRSYCRKVLKAGQWGTAQQGLMLAHQGHRVSRLYYIAGGGCVIKSNGKHIGRLEAPMFHGHIAIVNTTPANWTAEADAGMRYWSIDAKVFRKLIENPVISRGFESAFFHDIKRYTDILTERLLLRSVISDR